MKFLYRFLIVFGLSCYVFGIYLIWERTNPNRLAFKNYVGNYKNLEIANPPTRIIIKNLNIDLPLYPAKIINNKWETTTKGASYLISSPVPGNIGNSIIYGHDWSSLFGPLLSARKGDVVEIEYTDKIRKVFVVNKTLVVSPDAVGILENTDERLITLYTCTGFLDSKRFVATAILK